MVNLSAYVYGRGRGALRCARATALIHALATGIVDGTATASEPGGQAACLLTTN
jgi:hypothetical protein